MAKEFKPFDTAPKNGSLIITPLGHVLRWMAYKESSAQWIAGEEGRWQVMGPNGVWLAAKRLPKLWCGYSFPPKSVRRASEVGT